MKWGEMSQELSLCMTLLHFVCIPQQECSLYVGSTMYTKYLPHVRSVYISSNVHLVHNGPLVRPTAGALGDVLLSVDPQPSVRDSGTLHSELLRHWNTRELF